MPTMFKLRLPFKLAGDQPKAVKELTAAFRAGKRQNVLLGVTGSGKTATMSAVIQELQKPTLIISPNKTLAEQLYQEFKEFFPENAVHYFVSYYDYYQPEAYLPVTNTYIEKDAKINEAIDQLRHAATADILSQENVIVVASVSCIYGIGDPIEYERAVLELKIGEKIAVRTVLRHLTELQYERNDLDPHQGNFRVRGDVLEVYTPAGERFWRLEWSGEVIEAISEHRRALGDERVEALTAVRLFPAKHFVMPRAKLELALKNIEDELQEALERFRREGKLLEAERLEERVHFDIEMLRETGYCHGIENYSRPLSFRRAGEPPATLIDYFLHAFGRPRSETRDSGFDHGWLLMIDESHIAIPQVRGMYGGDRSRKEVLVRYGFRLPSALDNRPLQFAEFESKTPPTLYVSATPGPYEIDRARHEGVIAEQIARPTGLLDPTIEVRPTHNQIKDLVTMIKKRTAKGQRSLVTTLTKRLAEDITEYLTDEGIKVQYLHSDVKTLLRPEILNDLRKGNFDAIVGINLLREGLDLPEVSFIAILDADKEGFLRNETTLIQTMGRAARHVEGHVILYADTVTGSMRRAMAEVERRRTVQESYNATHGITPRTIEKAIREYDLPSAQREAKQRVLAAEIKGLEPFLRGELPLDTKAAQRLIKELEGEMRAAAERLDFERAAKIRDLLQSIAKSGKFATQDSKVSSKNSKK
ncbi:MAG: excinuclease ABC subunit UvrB [Patescibacteria group bacterium]|nr:excinuclease ABC subunit UvrB [Patescibacteria group bacterium]